jgi:hypothetical protein
MPGDDLAPPPPVGYDQLSDVALAAMSGSHDHDQEHVVGNRVDDAVVAHPYPATGPIPRRPGGRRSRVVGKESNRSLNTRTEVRVELT